MTCQCLWSANEADVLPRLASAAIPSDTRIVVANAKNEKGLGDNG
jgi:hypothetical protein